MVFASGVGLALAASADATRCGRAADVAGAEGFDATAVRAAAERVAVEVFRAAETTGLAAAAGLRGDAAVGLAPVVARLVSEGAAARLGERLGAAFATGVAGFGEIVAFAGALGEAAFAGGTCVAAGSVDAGLADAGLVGVDPAGADLAGADLVGADLANADLAGAELAADV